MTDFTTLPIEDLYESTLQSDLGSTDLIAKTVKNITGTLTGGDTCYMGINYDRPSKYELVEISAISGQNVTITNRAVMTKAGGTPVAQNHPAGSKVIITHSYKVFKDIQDAVNSKANSSDPTFTTAVKLPSYANAAARDLAIPAPTKNMTVILDNDGDSKLSLSTYSGSVWRNITLPGRNVTINGFLSVVDGYVKFPIYTNATTRNAGIPVPVRSMVIYNTAAVTLQLYDGSNWVDLDIGTPVPVATTSVAGRTRLATDAQVLSRTNLVGSDPLVVQPSQVDLNYTLNVIPLYDIPAGTPIGVPIGGWSSSADIPVAPLTSTGFLATNFLLPGTTPILIDFEYLGTDRIFIVYRENTVNLRCIVATINKNTGGFTYGTSQIVDSNTNTVADLTVVDTDRVLITYVIPATNTVVRDKIATVTGIAISLGAQENAFTHSGAVTSLQLRNITTNISIIVTNTTFARVLDSTAAINAGAEVTLATGGTLVNLTTNSFAIGGYNVTAQVQAGTIAGVTITLGTAYSVVSTGFTDFVRLSSANVGFTYAISTTNSVPNILSIAGNVISLVFSGFASHSTGAYPNLKRINNTSLVYVFSNSQFRYSYLTTTYNTDYNRDTNAAVYIGRGERVFDNYTYNSGLTGISTGVQIPIAFAETALTGGVPVKIRLRGFVFTRPEFPTGLAATELYGARSEFFNSNISSNSINNSASFKSTVLPVAIDKVIFI